MNEPTVFCGGGIHTILFQGINVKAGAARISFDEEAR